VVALGGGNNFAWKWVPSQGHSGGLLMGIDEDVLEVTDYQESRHFLSMVLEQKDNNFKWKLFNVYGPVQDNHKLDFLNSLEAAITDSEVPFSGRWRL
jgi:hypothetical protein